MLFVFVMLLQFPFEFLVVMYVGFRVVMEDIDGYRGERESGRLPWVACDVLFLFILGLLFCKSGLAF